MIIKPKYPTFTLFSRVSWSLVLGTWNLGLGSWNLGLGSYQ